MDDFNLEDFYDMFLNQNFVATDRMEFEFLLTAMVFFKDQITFMKTTHIADKMEITIKLTKDTGGSQSLETVDPSIAPFLNEE